MRLSKLRHTTWCEACHALMGISWREQSGEIIEQDRVAIARKVSAKLSCGHAKVIVVPSTSKV